MGVPTLGKDHSWETNQAARAAWLYFVGELTQSEIARRLGVSKSRVHRLIQLAKHQGVVKISIEGRPAECLSLEVELCSRYLLKSCTISPFLSANAGQDDLSNVAVAQAGGQLIGQHLALGRSRTVTVDVDGALLMASVEAMPHVVVDACHVYAAQGCLSSHFTHDPSDLFMAMVRRTGATCHPLPVPYEASSATERDVLAALPTVQKSLRAAEKADLFLLDIGAAQAPAGTDGPAAGQPVACRLLGSAFDDAGQRIADPSAGVRICVEVANVFPRVHDAEVRCIGLAAGTQQRRAVLAALRSGLITDLVIDEGLANAVLSADYPGSDATA